MDICPKTHVRMDTCSIGHLPIQQCKMRTLTKKKKNYLILSRASAEKFPELGDHKKQKKKKNEKKKSKIYRKNYTIKPLRGRANEKKPEK